MLLFQPFLKDISSIVIPEKFTFPFYYEAHELSIIAAKELQHYLEHQKDFTHNFGLDSSQDGLVIGKMFGVLVVQNQNQELGYLWAFSGKLANTNHHPLFVPTVFDMLEEDSFFKQEEAVLNQYNQQINSIETDTVYLSLLKEYDTIKSTMLQEINEHKLLIKHNKKQRAIKRANNLTAEEQHQLDKESQEEGILLKKMTAHWNYKLKEVTENLELFNSKINQLKEERKNKSGALQQQLFSKYAFLNQYLELKSLSEIFNGNPPAGAGECAAPKLIHYAFQHHLKPIAMAEFWWGQSPKAEMRKHKQFYPACIGKCEPILKHMLQDIAMDENPFAINHAKEKELKIVYEDPYLWVINKPAEFLSVPGKQVEDSVISRMKLINPDAMIVHRLDMSTSGLLLVAKNYTIYKKLQYQFIKRKISKRYVALLDGSLEKDHGYIDLPIRGDLYNRPYQIVCHEQGKSSQTRWEVIHRKDNKTLVYFYPITGRTHQLRVHAAHASGLNMPIVGDDLYGTKADRLYLHAESITFEHPVTKELIMLNEPAGF